MGVTSDTRYPLHCTNPYQYLFQQCLGIGAAWLGKKKAKFFDMRLALLTYWYLDVEDLNLKQFLVYENEKFEFGECQLFFSAYFEKFIEKCKDLSFQKLFAQKQRVASEQLAAQKQRKKKRQKISI